MIRVYLILIFNLFVSVSSALADDPTGSYRVEGNNPDGRGSYKGVVDVTKTDETYKVVWRIGGDTFVGTAIGDGKFLAVSYVSSGATGLAVYSRQGEGDTWLGVWTYAGGTRLGSERWIGR